MAKDNEIIRELKKKFNNSLADMKKISEISYRPRSTDPNGTKANDICVEVDGKIAVVIHVDDNYPSGMVYTDNLSEVDKKKVTME